MLRRMKIRLFIPVLLIALSGCSSLARQDGDWFETSGRSAEQFEYDNQACHAQATQQVDDNFARSFDSWYGQTRAFNAVYTRCMTARHYHARAYFENWLPSRG
jgi:hypothetical protein